MPQTNMDIAEFTHHYEKYKKPIFNYIFYRVSFNRNAAEDLTSEIFLKAFEHFGSFDPSRSFKSWIFAIAHNHLINFFASKKETLSLDEAITSLKEIPNADIIDQNLMVSKILRLVAELPQSQREIIILKYVNDLSNSEIAKITGKEEGAIRTTLSRGIAALRDKYNFKLSKQSQ